MKKLLTFLLLVLLTTPAFAQYEQDVKSIDSIIEALYEVISGPAGEQRDWDRFEYLFIEDGRLMPTGQNQQGEVVYRNWGVKEYVERVDQSFLDNGFFELEVSREVEDYRNIAHVFSTYKSMRTEGGEVFARGINSIQLLWDNERWWIVSVFWSPENAEYPVPSKYQKGEWQSLFDGESFDGWKANETWDTFSIEDGAIKVNGVRSHLYYEGAIGNHNFTDFEFKAKVMTQEGANSGIFFHTKYQNPGWPNYGYEAQVNNTFEGDERRTASLYNVDDNTEIVFPDDEWMDYYIKVEGDHVIIKINDQVITDYKETADRKTQTIRFSSGTFALQGHDPGSTVYFKDIYVREL